MNGGSIVLLLMWSAAVSLSALTDPENDVRLKQHHDKTDPYFKAASTNYRAGVGKADMTGPAADVNMMGYANPSQNAAGVHLRQFARSFIVEDIGNDNKSAVFVNLDACMATDALKREVVNLLKEKGAPYSKYNDKNILITGTHTHSTPAGFHMYLLYDITALGFVNSTMMAYAEGIVKSIMLAHDNLQPANILINNGDLLDANINRSPQAYANNPPEEIAKYAHNTDKEMVVLKFIDEKNRPFGMISWYAVHCTSMNNTNLLISSDNKGYAAQLFERYMEPNVLTGRGKFVAAFAQSNEGDVSPKTQGPHCLDTGKPCDNVESTCNGQVKLCVAFGPGRDMMDSTRIIGEKQFNKAKELFDSAKTPLSGPVDFVHQYVDMTNQVWTEQSSSGANVTYKTCPPSMGFSFAAGTTDGPGMFSFKQGDTNGNALWDLVRDFIKEPSAELTECQKPKPILLPTGEMTFPYAWQPSIVPTQILRVGDLLITAVPGEFSTMAGRRTRNAVVEAAKAKIPNGRAVIAGLANSYSSYIATEEEYQVQRYEGASTIYGPHTLRFYLRQFAKLAGTLGSSTALDDGPAPADLSGKVKSLLPGVVMDTAPLFHKFGDVKVPPKKQYTAGDRVVVTFVSANPRNNLLHGQSFLEVQMKNGSKYDVVLTDDDWDTQFHWIRESTIRGTSIATISWMTRATSTPGQYRICHYGSSKSVFQKITPFSGCTDDFAVVR